MKTGNYRSDVNLLNLTGKLLSTIPQLITHTIHNQCNQIFNLLGGTILPKFLFQKRYVSDVAC